MNKILISFFMVFLIQQCIATCSDNQIDINSASKEQLDELYGIGVVKAQAIIDTRDFENVDDLIRVYGIGEKTLQKIKEQGLACVDGEDNEQDNEEDKEKENLEEQKDSELTELSLTKESVNDIQKTEEIKLEIINLNTKNIKSEDNKEELEEPNKSKYAIYGFMVFCVLLSFLFIIKNKYRKNEFE